MMQALPSTRDAARLGAELRLVPHAGREEAVQEAWLAHLSGRSPVRAVNTFARRERRRRRRAIACSFLS
jgi:hypothetical protein